MTQPVTRDNVLVQALIEQRNAAMNQLASTLADLEVAKARIAELEQAGERLKALEEKIAALEAKEA